MPDKLGEGEVLVKMIAAPITEFDASFISGFGAKRAGSVLPATGGNEGLGIVQGVGAGVSGFSEGDHVVPTVSGVGESTARPARPARLRKAGTALRWRVVRPVGGRACLALAVLLALRRRCATAACARRLARVPRPWPAPLRPPP